MDNDALVTVEHLTHDYRLGRGFFVRALDDVSLSIRRSEILGLVGESGSGKSTLGLSVMNLLASTSGRVIFDGIDTSDRAQLRRNRRRLSRERQIIFQDSASALNPRMTVRRILEEPLRIHRQLPSGAAREELLRRQLHYVGVEPHYLDSRPSELSGGQRQRVSIARALMLEPKLVVADEPVASLDVSIQAQIVNLFQHLQAEHGFTFLFIAHDLAMVEFLCDRVGVMLRGRLVELAPARELYLHPAHAYTRMLLSAMPKPDPRTERLRKAPDSAEILLTGREMWTQVGEDHFALLEEGDA